MLESYDVHGSVMGHLSLNDLRWYSLTCKAIYAEVQGYYERNYSLNPILERFIPSTYIPAFRRLQKENGLVISGSVALQFLHKSNVPNLILTSTSSMRVRLKSASGSSQKWDAPR